MANGRGRREPVFDANAEAGALDLRLSPEDRAGGHMGRRRRAARGRGRGTSGPAARPAFPQAPEAEAPSRRFVFRRLFYFAIVLGLWGVIGIAGIVAYYASQLPPIDQLAVPKRPPNIAILAADGSLLANRGEMGGRTVAIKELPPYLPKAFVAIEDRRFYDHFGVDPVGIARALDAQPHLARRRAGRLDPDPAARQEPVPDPGAHRLAQDPGGDPRPLAGAQLHQGPDPRTLPQPGLFRRRRLRRRGGGAALFRQVGPQCVARRRRRCSPASCRRRRASRPNRNPEAAQARGRPRARGHGRSRLHHAGHDQDGARRSRRSRSRAAAPDSANYAADYVMDVLDDFVGTVDIRHRRHDHHRARAAGRRRARRSSTSSTPRARSSTSSQGAFVAMQPDGAVKALVGGRNYADEPVQPGDRGAAPARLAVQALRLSRRDRARA